MVRRAAFALAIAFLTWVVPAAQGPSPRRYTITDLGTLGGTESNGAAINPAGLVTGSADTAGDAAFHAFRSDGTTMTDLGTLGGTYSDGYAINAAGLVTGRANTAGNTAFHAFRSDGTTMTDLGTLGGTYSFGIAINSAGLVTGWSDIADNADHAFVAIPDIGMLDLNELIPTGSGWTLERSTGINNKGQITGYGTINGQEHAFLLTPEAPK